MATNTPRVNSTTILTPPPTETTVSMTVEQAKKLLVKDGFNKYATDKVLTKEQLQALNPEKYAAYQEEFTQQAVNFASKLDPKTKEFIVPGFVNADVVKNDLAKAGVNQKLNVKSYTGVEMNTWGDGETTVLMAVEKGKDKNSKGEYVTVAALWRDAHLTVEEGKPNVDVVGTMLSVHKGSDGKEVYQPVEGQSENGTNIGIAKVGDHLLVARRVGLSKNSVDAIAGTNGWESNSAQNLEGRVEVSEELQKRVKDAIPSNLGYFVNAWTADEDGRSVVEVRARIASKEKAERGQQGKLRGIPTMVGDDLMLIGVSAGMSDYVDKETHFGGSGQNESFVINPVKDSNNTKHLQRIMSNLHCALEISRNGKTFNNPDSYANYVESFYQTHRNGNFNETINYTSMTVGPIEMDQFTGLPWSTVGKYSMNGDNQFAYHEDSKDGNVNLYSGIYDVVGLSGGTNELGVIMVTDKYRIDGSNKFYMLTPDLKSSLANENIDPPGPMDKIAIRNLLESVEGGVANSLYDIGITKENATGSDFRFKTNRDPYFAKTLLKDFGGVNLATYPIEDSLLDEVNGFLKDWLNGPGVRPPMTSEQKEVVKKFVDRLNNIPNLTPFETEKVSLK